jgi:hypothetical protein
MALVSAFIPATLGASSLVVACDNDVDTPPWYPNYTDSGYGGAKAKGGAGGAAGATGSSGVGGGTSSAGSSEAGEGGAP